MESLKEAGMKGTTSDAMKVRKGDTAELAEERLKNTCWVPAWLSAAQPKAAETETDNLA